MSTTELVRHQGVDIDIMDRLDTATFEELAETARVSIELAGQYADSAVRQLVRAGGVLVQIRDRMPGRYKTWLREIGIDPTWASKVGRLYEYRDAIPATAYETRVDVAGRRLPPSLRSALASIDALPNRQPHRSRLTDEMIRDAKARHRRGESMTSIAVAMGVSREQMRRLLNPAVEAERRKRAKANRKIQSEARAALQKQQIREERDRMARATGGELSVAYTLIRKALSALAKTNMDQTRRASEYLVAAESNIVSAMREERTAP